MCWLNVLSTFLVLAFVNDSYCFSPSFQSPTKAGARGLRSSTLLPKEGTLKMFYDANEETSHSSESADHDEVPDVSSSTPEEADAEPTEDPEVAALKEEIEKLESTLKMKKSSLAYTRDQVDEYSKAGYARKVAEMENMRRVRRSMNSSSKSSAAAAVLTDFLPVEDKLVQLKARYADNEFGSKYGGLSMDQTFSKMGVTEYSAETGEAFESERMAAIEEEHSEEFAEGTVVRLVTKGIEIDGNIIRAAECVVSLGSEKTSESEELPEPAED